MNQPPITRASLILRLRHSHDAAAWQEFVDIYQPLIFRIARSRGLQEADAFDTTQEVLARVAKAINRWNPDPECGSFRGWIGRITRNLVVEFLRSSNRLPVTSDDSTIGRLVQQTPQRSRETDLYDLEHERQVFAWAARKVEQQFQPRTWQAFWQTAVQHHPVQYVADELNLSCGAVYIARSRVMARLKQVVQTHLGENAPLTGEVQSPFHAERSEP